MRRFESLKRIVVLELSLIGLIFMTIGYILVWYTAYGLNENLAIYRRPGKSLSSNKFVAVQRIWFLYRKQAGLSVVKSAYYFVMWAFLAVWRRI